MEVKWSHVRGPLWPSALPRGACTRLDYLLATWASWGPGDNKTGMGHVISFPSHRAAGQRTRRTYQWPSVLCSPSWIVAKRPNGPTVFTG
jgi:hypothetical protein